MKRLGRPWSQLAIIVAVTVMSAGAVGSEETIMTHRGFDGCVQLQVADTQVVAIPAWAGRLSVVDFGAGNILRQDPNLDGKQLPSDVPWMPWDGNATDIKRTSDGRNQWPGLWLHPWQVVESSPRSVKMQSPENQDLGLSASKHYELSADGKKLTYTFAVQRVSGDEQAGWTVTERAMMPLKGGYLIVKAKKSPAFPAGWKNRDGTTVEPADRLTAVGDYLVLRPGTQKGAGLEINLQSGWIGIVTADRDGQPAGVMLLRFPLSKDGPYPHYDASHFVPWIAPDFIEVEPVSPEFKLKVGEQYQFTQEWQWLGVPKIDDPADPQKVAQWIESQLPCSCCQ
ncbi:MAG: hypothetical protein IT443_01185 [Phycisphaeraceae bacterium]|nr:hypothetical protein [Phycisphaeraceae bacterium]